MTTRAAIKADAAEIARIVNAAFLVEREFRPGDRTSAAEIEKLIESFLVSEKDGRMTGAVHVSVDSSKGSKGYFGMLAIDPLLQGAGLGRQLLEAAEDHCRRKGCSEMTMSTGEERKELVAWYQRLGYRVTSAAASDNAAFSRPIRVVQMSKPL
jgi:N-acetylglutamate synthase-like GNAT family acetyltransferase